jgi:hypothetical protein
MYADIREIIEKYFADNWTETTVDYDNVPFRVPARQAWVRLRIYDNFEDKPVIGQPYHRLTGFLSFDVFAPLNTGSVQSRQITDSIIALFRNKTINGITLPWQSGIQVTRIGQRSDTNSTNDAWYMTNITISFKYDRLFLPIILLKAAEPAFLAVFYEGRRRALAISNGAESL